MLVCGVFFTIIVVISLRLMRESDMELDYSLKKSENVNEEKQFNEHYINNSQREVPRNSFGYK